MPRTHTVVIGGGPRPTTLTTYAQFPFKTLSPDKMLAAAGARIIAPHIMATQDRSVDNKDGRLNAGATGVIDPTEYINRVWMPRGAVEGPTDHATYGGYYRNRPIGRAPLTGSGTIGTATGWHLADKMFQLQSLWDAFYPNAFIDVLGSNTFPAVQEWAQAAVALGRPGSLIFMPDSSVSIVRNGPANLANYSQQAFTGTWGTAWKKHTDGRFLVIPYGPEYCLGDPASTTTPISSQQVIDFWVAYCQAMDAAGVPIALGCMFSRLWTDPNQKTAPTMTNAALKPWVVYLGRWGQRSPGGVNAPGNNGYDAATYSVSNYGLPYIDTIGVEDTRPSLKVYAEPLGWQLWRDSHMRVINTKCAGMEVATANDFGEGTAMFPSELWGYSALDIGAYYNAWQITGSAPEIDKDACYLAYRTMNIPGLGTQPILAHDSTTKTVTNADLSTTVMPVYTKKMVKFDVTAGVNNVFVCCFATAPAFIRATIGGITEADRAIPAGLSEISFPMRTGTISISMIRNSVVVPGTAVGNLPGQPINIENQDVQDFTYRRVSSLRS